VRGFHLSRSFKRIMKRNADLVSAVVQPQATQEHYELFRAYVDTRHADGGMADMSVLDFAAMIDETMVDTRLVEYRYVSGHPKAGQLAAAVLVDLLQDGLSLIYSFYDTSEPSRSFGSFVILDSIERVKRVGLGYLYLGYYVKGARKMEYKARFSPQERLGPHGWALA
jgi:arginine-tRNA-protein transferase